MSSIAPQLSGIYRTVFVGVGDADQYTDAVKNLKDSLKVLNTHLAGKEYLVGSSVTVADAIALCYLILPFQVALDPGYRKAMPQVTAWFERMTKLPAVVKRFGNTKMCQKVVKPTVPAKEKPKAAPQQQKKEKPEGEEAPAKKEADPLDELPPSPFNLFDFKTFYVNHKDKKGEAMQFFFDNYDPAGYTVYHCVYDKYPGEGEVLYQTSNLLNGFLQRIDHFRKHAFAMHAILGEEPNLDIEGVWLFRGKGIPQQMKDHPQFEYYKNRELDFSKPEDKQLITDFWGGKAGDIINGRKVQECKFHK